MKARKAWRCEGCHREIKRGEEYFPAYRPSGRYYPERVAVCEECAGLEEGEGHEGRATEINARVEAVEAGSAGPGWAVEVSSLPSTEDY